MDENSVIGCHAAAQLLIDDAVGTISKCALLPSYLPIPEGGSWMSRKQEGAAPLKKLILDGLRAQDWSICTAGMLRA